MSFTCPRYLPAVLRMICEHAGFLVLMLKLDSSLVVDVRTLVWLYLFRQLRKVCTHKLGNFQLSQSIFHHLVRLFIKYVNVRFVPDILRKLAMYLSLLFTFQKQDESELEKLWYKDTTWFKTVAI